MKVSGFVRFSLMVVIAAVGIGPAGNECSNTAAGRHG